MTYLNELIDIGQMLERRATAASSMTSGLSYNEVCMLGILQEGPDQGLTRAELATLISLTPSGVSRSLKPLEKLGYVTSARDERDARNSRAMLTPAGAERLSHAQAAIADAWASLDLELLKGDDVHAFASAMRAPRPRVVGHRPDWAAKPASPPVPKQDQPQVKPVTPGLSIPSRPGIKIA